MECLCDARLFSTKKGERGRPIRCSRAATDEIFTLEDENRQEADGEFPTYEGVRLCKHHSKKLYETDNEYPRFGLFGKDPVPKVWLDTPDGKNIAWRFDEDGNELWGNSGEKVIRKKSSKKSKSKPKDDEVSEAPLSAALLAYDILEKLGFEFDKEKGWEMKKTEVQAVQAICGYFPQEEIDDAASDSPTEAFESEGEDIEEGVPPEPEPEPPVMSVVESVLAANGCLVADTDDEDDEEETNDICPVCGFKGGNAEQAIVCGGDCCPKGAVGRPGLTMYGVKATRMGDWVVYDDRETYHKFGGGEECEHDGEEWEKRWGKDFPEEEEDDTDSDEEEDSEEEDERAPNGWVVEEYEGVEYLTEKFNEEFVYEKLSDGKAGQKVGEWGEYDEDTKTTKIEWLSKKFRIAHETARDEEEEEESMVEIDFEGVEYWECENTGKIFQLGAKTATFHEPGDKAVGECVGLWNANCDGIVWEDEKFQDDHETARD